MKQEKQDRRSRRTRRLVNQALLDLLFEKRYDTITIQDILDRAEIGRTTFYTHYFDKEDVLADMAAQMLETFTPNIAQDKERQELISSLALFSHVQEHAQHFQALLRGHAGAMVWEVSQASLSKNIEQKLATLPEARETAVPLILLARVVAETFVTVLKWWLESDLLYTPEEVDQVFRQLALPGVWAALARKSA